MFPLQVFSLLTAAPLAPNSPAQLTTMNRVRLDLLGPAAACTPLSHRRAKEPLPPTPETGFSTTARSSSTATRTPTTRPGPFRADSSASAAHTAPTAAARRLRVRFAPCPTQPSLRSASSSTSDSRRARPTSSRRAARPTFTTIGTAVRRVCWTPRARSAQRAQQTWPSATPHPAVSLAAC